MLNSSILVIILKNGELWFRSSENEIKNSLIRKIIESMVPIKETAEQEHYSDAIINR